MSLFLGDLRIKAAITLGLEDIAKNPWLLNDILGDTVANEYMRRFYGSQIESCKQWLANNRINFFMSERDDKIEFPCVVIEMGTSNEKSEMKHMGDLSTESVTLYPNDINKPIPFLIKPTPGSYDPISGAFTFSSDVNISMIVPGQVLVDPVTGNGYVIQSVTMMNQVNLMTGLTLSAAAYAVIPQYQTYEAKIGHTFMTETYKITCNAMDQNTTLWLWSIVVYSLLRYRQVLLEKDGYAESMISSGKLFPNPDYSDAGQVIWSREVNLTGQVESRWLNQPHRYIESVGLGNGDGFTGGLKIISNKNDTFEDLTTVNWSTIQNFVESLE
jgi:hypothetical protein